VQLPNDQGPDEQEPDERTTDEPATASPKRRRPWKKPGKQVRNDYRITLEIGIVLALAVILGLTQLRFSVSDTFSVQLAEQEVVEMEEVQQTQQEVAPPPPPRPTAPVEVPNNAIVEQQALNFDASLDLDASLDVGGPPPEAEQPPTEPEEEEEEIFVAVEDEPELIGGMASLQELIEYPEPARRAGIEGRVIVQFVVNEEGDATNPTVVRGRHALLDKEALRVIRMAKFEPGRQRGEPVKVRMALPVIFRLAD
jgi:protein TonB